MSRFIEIKAMAGVSFVRAAEVIAVQHVDPQRATIMLAGGAQLACSEPAKAIMTRVEDALRTAEETTHGHAGR